MATEFAIGATRAEKHRQEVERLERLDAAKEAGDEDLIVAIEAEIEEAEPSETVEYKIGGRMVEFYYPTPGQTALIFLPDNLVGQQRYILQLLGELCVDPEDYEWFMMLLREGAVDFDFFFGGDAKNPSGLVQTLVLEAAGRPTGSSPSSSRSPKSAGRRSTGRVRKAASTSGSSR